MLPDVIENPLRLLSADLEAVRTLGGPMAGVGCLATVDADGQPHARMVTLREVDEASVGTRVVGGAVGAVTRSVSVRPFRHDRGRTCEPQDTYVRQRGPR